MEQNPGEQLQDQELRNPGSEISNFVSDISHIEMEGYEIRVRKARNALFWTAGLIFLGEMISMFSTYHEVEPLVLGIAFAEAAIFVALALWTKKKPYTAIITGIILFTVLILLAAGVNGYVDGAEGVFKALFGGIIVKVLIYLNLIRAVKDAKLLQKAKEEGLY